MTTIAHNFTVADLCTASAEVNVLEHQLQYTPLGWAARYGNVEVVHYLLQRAADPI